MAGSALFAVALLRHSCFSALLITDPDGEAITISSLAGFADSHDDSAPVGVGGSESGFHQRRVGDSPGYDSCGIMISRPRRP